MSTTESLPHPENSPGMDESACARVQTVRTAWRALPTFVESRKIGADTTTKTDPTAQSGTTSRLPCIIPVT